RGSSFPRYTAAPVVATLSLHDALPISEGPFTPEPVPMAGSYSIDPSIYTADDGEYYMYFGGIWGGQLQKYRDNSYDDANEEPAEDRKSTRLNSSHVKISYAVFCLKKKK